MRSDYSDFVRSKQFDDIASGFDIHVSSVGIQGGQLTLKEFQSHIVKWALARGRAAIFANTGLGKTAMQATWAYRVSERTGLPVLIVAPLCVAKQTVSESAKFGVDVRYVRTQPDTPSGIYVTNYEMLDEFDPYEFGGIVLDESSILKDRDGKMRNKIINDWRMTPYRLSCTATPSPNDYMELGNQSEFLGVMNMDEMLAMFFTHDGGDTSKWRLKGHGRRKFWEWMATWAVTIRKPSDLGFSDEGYDLPPLQMHEHQVSSDFGDDLFTGIAQTLNERRQAKRETLDARVSVVADLVNNSDDAWIVWCHTNDESAALKSAIADAMEIRGSDSIDYKESTIQGFVSGVHRVLVTKPSIAGMGLNLQHCANMAFVGLDDSFEQMYQAVRRCWRFGQDRLVNAHYVTSESLGAVLANITRKESQMEEMQASMVDHMKKLMQKEIRGTQMEKTEYRTDVACGDGWEMHLGDCVDVIGKMDEESIDYTIFSPPFASLYTYSNSDYDMGNVRDDDEFMGQFRFLVEELLRVTKPGRLLSFHCMNLPTTKVRDGFIGIKDFRGELIRLFVEKGWIYHSEVCIWKDPVTAMQRTKALGLLHKQIKKDSAMSRQGIADYLVTMRKLGENPDPVTHTNESFPVEKWQNYASPVWMDINPSRTLSYRDGRDDDDERHICPLQLDVIERAIDLWTNPGDLVLSPFGGIGSEPVTAIRMGRRAIAVELKESYWKLAVDNLRLAERETMDMFSGVA
jgi:DNA modification methylase